MQDLTGKRTLPQIILLLLVVAASLVLLAPRTAKFAYDYKRGTVWKYESLVASFDFPILKTEEQLVAERERLSHISVPYYRYSSEVVSRALKAASEIDFSEWKISLVPVIQSIYEKGVVSDEGIRQGDNGSISPVLFVQKGNRAGKCLVEEVYKLSDARDELYLRVNQTTDCPCLDSLFLARSVYDLIVPNLIYDPQTTSLVDSESKGNISPTLGYVSAGQLIVSEGELITSEIAQILDSYKAEYETNLGYSGPQIVYWSGNALVLLVVLTILFFVLWFSDKSIFQDNRFIYILFIILLFSAIELLVIRFKPSMRLMLPLALSALYLQAFIKPSVIVPIYVVSLLPVLLYADSGPAIFAIYLLTGLLNIFLFPYLGKGWKQFLLSMITFFLLGLAYLGFVFVEGNTQKVLSDLSMLFFASLLNIALYPLTYLFEKIFNLVSNSRLAELADTSNRILRELEHKAPGTFQHSLQVMNMADAAARAIDANSVMVRTAALYHDIGKLSNPQCFVENESLVNKLPEEKYHYGLSPQQSAHDIIRHVTDGVEIARREHLPSLIEDFITSHHGDSLAGFFWNKYLNGGGDASAEADFRYPGPRPRTKEQIILMLCDSIEAASRTLASNTPEAYSAFVEKIVSGKMAEGQFDDAEISIKELGVLKETIKTYLAQMHHGRITYPKRKLLNKR